MLDVAMFASYCLFFYFCYSDTDVATIFTQDGWQGVMGRSQFPSIVALAIMIIPSKQPVHEALNVFYIVLAVNVIFAAFWLFFPTSARNLDIAIRRYLYYIVFIIYCKFAGKQFLGKFLNAFSI
jgi:hypothetical protein